MSKLTKWINDARERLGRGLLSRKEYERSLALNEFLAEEVFAAYAAIEPGNSKLVALGNDRIAEAMKRVGVS